MIRPVLSWLQLCNDNWTRRKWRAQLWRLVQRYIKFDALCVMVCTKSTIKSEIRASRNVIGILKRTLDIWKMCTNSISSVNFVFEYVCWWMKKCYNVWANEFWTNLINGFHGIVSWMCVPWANWNIELTFKFGVVVTVFHFPLKPSSTLRSL